MVAAVTPPVPGVTGAVGTKVAGWCAALCRASQCLAWLLGDGAGSQTKGGRVPCPVPPHREKLPGSSWHRSRKKGESIWEDREEKKDQRLKTEQKNPHPIWIQRVALHAIPGGENIPEGIFHYCSATLVSLLKTSECASPTAAGKVLHVWAVMWIFAYQVSWMEIAAWHSRWLGVALIHKLGGIKSHIKTDQCEDPASLVQQ